jgi:DNA-binding MarR family transcriptional regulator
VSETSAEETRYARLLEVEHEVAVLHQSTRARLKLLVERFDPELQPAGFGVLRYVIANEPIRAGGIAAALGIDKSAVSRQLTILRDAGLIDTRPDPEDGRATLLVGTPAAREALDAFRSEVRSGYERVLAEWDSEEVAQFARLLRKFNHSLSQRTSEATSRQDDGPATT